ncbi:MAG: peptide ABC transporter substrate-binding protein [Thermomicrobiales bacterium]
MGSKNPVMQLNDLYLKFTQGEIDRRTLLARAGTLGLSAWTLQAFANGVSAQDASPEAGEVVLPGGFTSMTREEYKARLAEDYPFTAEELTKGGTVIFGVSQSSNLTTLNPMYANNFPTQDFVLMVFEGLWGLYPKGGGDIVPGLADSYEIAEDGLTYTFHLNPDATWHDGNPVTSADVVFSLDAQANEAVGSQYTGQFVNTVASWSAIDDHTVQLVATDIMAQLVFYSNAFMPIIPKHIWEGVPVENWQTDPGSTGQDPSRVIGSGPFRVRGISEAEGTATFIPNENYYDDVPVMERLIFQTWPDDVAVTEALRAGDIDIYDSPTPTDVPGLQEEEHLEVVLYDSYLFSWLGFNLDPEKTPLFQDRAVRQALLYALDRETMLQAIYLGFGEVANGPLSPNSPRAYAPDEMNTVYTYDPELAASMLDEAGWVVGSDGIREKDGVKLSFRNMYGSASVNDQMAAALRTSGKPLASTPCRTGRLRHCSRAALVENFDFQMCMLAFDWASPGGDQSAMFGTEMKGAASMPWGTQSPVRRADCGSQSGTRSRQRRELLVQASNIVNDDLPVIVLVVPRWSHRI